MILYQHTGLGSYKMEDIPEDGMNKLEQKYERTTYGSRKQKQHSNGDLSKCHLVHWMS